MDKHKIKGNLMLILTALIWGTSFVAQSVGMEYVGPFTFLCIRSIIGGIFLIPCIIFLNKINEKNKEKSNNRGNRKQLIIGGICCGIILCIASSFQQIGIMYTSVGKAGFITALYIVIVPILGLLFKHKVKGRVWISVAIAVVGLYLLCINENLQIGKGDFLILICSVGFSIHIMVIDYFSPLVDGVYMSCIQFLVSGVLAFIPMVVFENPQIVNIISAGKSILYAGVMSCGVAYTLQIVGQKYTSPVLASLILSLESVFAAVSGWLILGEVFSAKEFLGCCLVFAAIIITQLPERKRKV